MALLKRCLICKTEIEFGSLTPGPDGLYPSRAIHCDTQGNYGSEVWDSCFSGEIAAPIMEYFELMKELFTLEIPGLDYKNIFPEINRYYDLLCKSTMRGNWAIDIPEMGWMRLNEDQISCIMEIKSPFLS